MAVNCLVTKLKVAVNNDNLDYLDKGLLLFDNTLVPTQTSQVNQIKMDAIAKSEMSCKEGDDKFSKSGTTYKVVVSTETAANTQLHIYYPLAKLTNVDGISGSGYRNTKLNYKLRMSDIIRCKNMTRCGLGGVTMDRYNIEELGTLTSLTFITIAGSASLESQWHGDVVNLADNFIQNGIDLTSNRVVVIADSGYLKWNVKVNGTICNRYIHLVFRADGYDIYAELSSASALSDYSGETPVYSKTI